MTDKLNPKPLVSSRNASLEADQDTYKSQLIREWIVAVEDNMKSQDINAGVTLYCIRCKNFDPSAVCDCVYNGCARWPFRTAGLKLDE
jgi:hypothetical protein